VARVYAALRGAGPALDGDRPFTGDIEKIAAGIKVGSFDPEARAP